MGYRLITKKDREDARKGWIQNKATEVYKDLEILKKDTPYVSLIIWKGTAGNPYINYSYRTIEQRNDALLREKGYADRREEYKIQNADRRGKVLSESAKASQKIKNILKKEYPSIKFSVRSDNYANGSSVDVSWVDGVPEADLDSFLNQFQYGSFDGMTDCYNYTNTKDMAQAKYVFGKREISKEKQEIIYQQLADLMGIKNDRYSVIPEEYAINVRGYAYQAPLSALVYQIAVKFDFSKGFTGVRCMTTEDGRKVSNMFEVY